MYYGISFRIIFFLLDVFFNTTNFRLTGQWYSIVKLRLHKPLTHKLRLSIVQKLGLNRLQLYKIITFGNYKD